jgi:hypothetical protein
MKSSYLQQLNLLFTISQSSPPATPQFSLTAGTPVRHEDILGNPSIYFSSSYRTLWPVSSFLLAALHVLTTLIIYILLSPELPERSGSMSSKLNRCGTSINQLDILSSFPPLLTGAGGLQNNLTNFLLSLSLFFSFLNLKNVNSSL